MVYCWDDVRDDLARVRHCLLLHSDHILIRFRNLATLMCAPAAPLILKDLSSRNQIDETLLVSIWELGEAFGPLLIAPLSEMYGRAPVYHGANVLFCIFSVASAVSSSMDMLIVFRFFNGIAVASVVLNPSIIGDMFITEQRSSAMSILTLAPLLGPVLGPVTGGYISKSIGWRWLFWLAAIFAAAIEIGFVFFFRETYKVQILRRKAKILRRETGDPSLRSEYDMTFSMETFLTSSIIRPARMLILSPIIFMLSFYVAVVFAYTYILFTTMTEVFEDRYGFSTGSASLTFLGLGVGFIIGMFGCKASLDRYVNRRKCQGGMKPEHRLPPMVFGGLLVPVSLFWYGWTVESHIHWIVPIIATAILGIAVISTLIPAFSYLVDAFGIHAASALAANITLRSVTGAFLPLVAPPLYRRLGFGWGNSLLGFTALAFMPVPFIMMKYGARIRSQSKFLVTS